MQEPQRTQQLLFETNGNGKHAQPALPIYTPPLQEDKTDEWDLRQFLTVVRRRALLIGGVAIALSAAVSFWTFSRQPEYEGRFQLLVEPVTKENKLEDLTQIPGISGKLPDQEGLDYDSQIKVLQSPELMAPIIQQIASRYPDVTYDSLFKFKDLKIDRFKETKILEVSYQDADPQKIQFVLQQLAKGFLKYSLQERQTNLRQGIHFVDAQLPVVQARVNGLQGQLQRFRQEYNFVDPEVKAQQLSEQVSTIQLQRLDTQKQLAQTRALYAALQGPAGAQIAQTNALDATLQNRAGGADAQQEAPIYEKLVGQLRDVESQIATEVTRFREDSPIIQSLRQKQENLRPVLQQEAGRVLGNRVVEVANQISLLEVRSASIAQAQNVLNQQIKQLPLLARQYSDLQLELKVAAESLSRFLEKRESLQVENAQNEIPWQVIAKPQLLEDPIFPKIPLNLAMGAIVGILAGLGAALLAERLDNVLHSAEELKELTKLPLLGLIPFRKNLKQLTPVAKAEVEKKPNGYKLVFRNLNKDHSESDFPFVEAFRSLHTNVNFLSSDTPIHSLVISSSVKGEGKSTVATHMAQAAAAMGRRVLLVDADLRLPQIHERLNVSNEQGLSNVISTNLPVSEAIQRSPLWDNLFVLTSGPVPPDPIKLLSSKKMQTIMEQLRQDFDLVIYDAPPLLGLADSSILANQTAGIVLVVRLGETDRSRLMQAIEQVRLSRATVLGTVLNGAKHHSNNSYNYYYYRTRTHSAEAN